jgi:hypothetical protein
MKKTKIKSYQRSDVWEIISRLFIKTEEIETYILSIVKELNKSGFSIEELNNIYYNEVSPVVYTNLIFGKVHTEFDREWLKKNIINYSNEKKILDNIVLIKRIKTWWFTKSTIIYWKRVIKLLSSMNIDYESMFKRISNKSHENISYNRSDVWELISEIFLDMELLEEDYQHIANNLNKSEYSIEELNNIYCTEVAPVLYLNLLSMTGGVWTGFKKDWLTEAIEARLKKRRIFEKIPVIKRVKTWWFTYMARDGWNKIINMVIELRKQEEMLKNKKRNSKIISYKKVVKTK